MSDLGNKQIMALNIRRYMAENNVTSTDICGSLGIPMPTFSDWIHAKTYPRIDKIEMLANYFGISKSDLVEERPIPVPENGPLREFHDLMIQLTPKEQRLIVAQIKGILSNRE